jgi:hypothetical protein
VEALACVVWSTESRQLDVLLEWIVVVRWWTHAADVVRVSESILSRWGSASVADASFAGCGHEIARCNKTNGDGKVGEQGEKGLD